MTTPNTSLTHRRYRTALEKYSKLKERYDKAVKSGSFKTFSSSKKHLVIKRLKKLWRQIQSLLMALRIPAAAGAMALALQATPVSAQQAFVPASEEDIRALLPRQPLEMGYGIKPVFVNLDADSDLELVLGSKYGDIQTFDKVAGQWIELWGEENPFNGIDVGKYSAPTFANLDGDADLELVVGNEYGTLNYFDKEEGVWVEKIEGDNPFDGIDAGKYSVPAFANLDGDADLELVVGTSNNGIRFYNKEEGEWVEKTEDDNPFAGIEIYNSAPTFANLDGDADLELVIGNNNGYLRYFNLETGDWVEKSEGDNPFYYVYSNTNGSPAFANLDGDADLELLIGTFWNNQAYYYELEGGEWTEAFPNPFGGFDLGNRITPTFVNLDADAEEELIIGTGSAEVLYFDRIDGVWADIQGYENPFDYINDYDEAAPAFANLDGDVSPEFVLGNDQGQLQYFNLNSNGEWVQQFEGNNPFASIDIAGGSNGYVIPRFVNLDADADPELVLGNKYGTLLYFDKEDGEWIEKTGDDNPFNEINVGKYSAPAFANLDADADLELLVAGDYTLRYYNLEEGEWVEQTEENNPFNDIYIDSNELRPTFTDIDGDGDQDLVVGIPEPALLLFKGISAPTDIVLSGEGIYTFAAAGDVIGTLSSVDPDNNAETFELVSGDGDDDNGSFTIEGDQLLLGAALSGTSYTIRVRVTDVDGLEFEKALVIPVVVLAAESDLHKQVSLHPNPMSSDFTVTIENSYRGNVDIELMDLTGRTVYTQKANKQTDLLEVPVKSGFLNKGITLAKVKAGTQVAVKKIVKE